MTTQLDCYISVRTHLVGFSNFFARRLSTPQWDILGNEEDEGFLVWYGVKNFKTGYQGHGQYIYTAKELGLDNKMCLTYYDQFERLKYEEGTNYDWDAMRPFYTPFMNSIQAYLDSVKPFIDAAVKERHDAWTRRRHLMALYTDPSRY